MISKYLGGNLETGDFGPSFELGDELSKGLRGYHEYMERMEFSRALGSYWPVIQRANRFIEEKSPWNLAKDAAKRKQLEVVLRELLAVIITSGVVLSPFMPSRMGKMLKQLGHVGIGIDDLPPREVGAEGLKPPEPLFPRMQGDPSELFRD
jgi:methionyl-tRNA synthetase